jgi:hypothetical protein
LNEKGIIFKLIFQMGCPVFLIAKVLETSEAEVYRLLNGEKMPPGAEDKLKKLLLDFIDRKEQLNILF